MAMLGEEVVVEWLNRNGYFTIRGIRVGNNEVDVLAIKPLEDGSIERRHIEVTLPYNPISYIAGGHSAKKRSRAEMFAAVKDWTARKYHNEKVLAAQQRLCKGEWTQELVLSKAKYKEEVKALEQNGINIIWFDEILQMLRKDAILASAEGGDLVQLMLAIDQVKTPTSLKSRLSNAK
jgi:hypothetical protein